MNRGTFGSLADDDGGGGGGISADKVRFYFETHENMGVFLPSAYPIEVVAPRLAT